MRLHYPMVDCLKTYIMSSPFMMKYITHGSCPYFHRTRPSLDLENSPHTRFPSALLTQRSRVYIIRLSYLKAESRNKRCYIRSTCQLKCKFGRKQLTLSKSLDVFQMQVGQPKVMVSITIISPYLGKTVKRNYN